MVAADSLVGGRLRHTSLTTFADTLALLAWITRRLETAPYVVPVGTVDSSQARRTISFAEELRATGKGPLDETLRACVAAAYSQLLLRDFRDAAASALRALSENTNPRGALARLSYELWITRARALAAAGAPDSGLAAADSARELAEGSWASSLDRAWADAWKASANLRRDDPTRALALFEAALPLLDASMPTLDRDLLELHFTFGSALVGTGDPRGSLLEYRRILDSLQRAGAEETLIGATVTEQIGDRETRLGDFAAGRRDEQHAVDVYRRLLGEHHDTYGFACGVLSVTLRNLGDLSGAERETRVDLNLLLARAGSVPARIADDYNRLAITYREMGRLDSALACIQRSYAIHAANPNPRNAGRLIALVNYANILGQAGQYEECARRADSAAVGLTALLGPNHQYVPAALLVKATAERACGRDSSALSLVDTVLARRVRKFGPLHPDVQDAWNERAVTCAVAGRMDEAAHDVLEALRLQRSIRQALVRGLDERTALALILKPTWNALDLAVTLAVENKLGPGDLRALYDEIVRDRSLLFDELFSRRHEGTSDSTSIDDRARLAHVRAEIARVLLSSGAGTGAILDSLSRVEAGLEEKAGSGSSAARLRGDPERVGLDDLRADLPPGSVLAGIVRYGWFDLKSDSNRWSPRTRPAYAAFVIHPGSANLQVIDLGDAGVADTLAAAWLACNGKLANSVTEGRLRRAGLKLRKRVFDPILGAARGAERVYLVPDGPLGMVDPATLPDDASGYLMEGRQRVLLLSSERELLERSPSSIRRGGRLLALGGPEFDAKTSNDRSSAELDAPERFTTCEEVRLCHFGPLPGAAAEAIAVSARWRAWAHGDTSRSALLLLGPMAREQALRESCHGSSVIHVATHGFELSDDCEVWSPEAAAMFRTLYRTGLALAGANDRTPSADPSDDGLLTAGEVSALDLSGVSLVCLSACESGLGDAVSGEGVHGLVRAFRIAGARQVVMSLWPVPDEDAARWNDAFYGGLLGRSLTVTEAARAASLRLLRARRAAHQSTPPYTWACFAVSGKDDR
jgi:CHAT domain-containing protein/tetratricopeptide (TPR) repeat protein